MKIIESVSDKALIVKDNVFLESRHGLTAVEQKVVLLLMSFINSTEDEHLYVYEVKTREILSLLGLGKDNYNYLNKVIENLYRREVEIKDREGEKVILRGRWISSYTPSYGGSSIKFGLDPGLQPYLLKLSKNFTKYSLSNVLSMKTGYSIRLYELLKKSERYSSCRYTVEAIRNIFQIPDDKYKRFSDLTRRIIKPSVEEINNKSDLHVGFSVIKNGRVPSEILFKIARKSLQAVGVKQDEQTDLINTLSTFNITYNKATELLEKHSMEHIKRNIEKVLEISDSNNKIENMAGLVIKAIEEDYAYKPPEILKKEKREKDKKEAIRQKRAFEKDQQTRQEEMRKKIAELQNQKLRDYKKEIGEGEFLKKLEEVWNSEGFKKKNEPIMQYGLSSSFGRVAAESYFVEEYLKVSEEEVYKKKSF